MRSRPTIRDIQTTIETILKGQGGFELGFIDTSAFNEDYKFLLRMVPRGRYLELPMKTLAWLSVAHTVDVLEQHVLSTLAKMRAEIVLEMLLGPHEVEFEDLTDDQIQRMERCAQALLEVVECRKKEK